MITFGYIPLDWRVTWNAFGCLFWAGILSYMGYRDKKKVLVENNDMLLNGI